MHMTFWWSTTIKNFLFPGFNINSDGGLVSICIGLAALAVLFEWLKLIQARHRQKELFLRARQIRTICPPSESATLLFNNRNAVRPLSITLCDRASLCLCDGLVWFNLQILGYMLMLVVMVYNGWMTIALIGGSGIGYFIFGPSFMKVNLENCQAIRETFCSLQCNDPEQDGETTPALAASASAASVSQACNQTSVCVVHAESQPDELTESI